MQQLHTILQHIFFAFSVSHYEPLKGSLWTGSTSRVPQDFLTAFSWDVVSVLYSQVILGHIAKSYHYDILGFEKYGYNLF